MTRIAFLVAAAAGFLFVLLTSPSEAGRRYDREYGVSNVSPDVCKRRLRRGESCDYTYWEPIDHPDYFVRPDRRFHRYYWSVAPWSFWPWW